MTDQTQRLEIATVRAEIGSNITYRFNNDAIDAGAIPTDSGDIKNLKLIIKEIEDKASVSTSIYTTTAEGLAATEEGGMFLVQSSEEDEIYVVWRKVAGAAVDTGKRALSSQAAEDAVESAQLSAIAAADSAVAAAAAASSVEAELEAIEEQFVETAVSFGKIVRPEQYPVSGPVGVGNAVADTAAWQAAANALPSGGKFKAEGDYLINGQITFPFRTDCQINLKGANIYQQQNFKQTLRFTEHLGTELRRGRFFGRGGAAGEYNGANSSYNGVAAVCFDGGDEIVVDGLRARDHAGGCIVMLGVSSKTIKNCNIKGIGYPYIDPVGQGNQGNGSDFGIMCQPKNNALGWIYEDRFLNNRIWDHAFGIQSVQTKICQLHDNDIGPCPGQHGFYGIENDGLSACRNTFRYCYQGGVKTQFENYSGFQVGPLWVSGTSYVAGEKARFSSILWICVTPNSDTTFTSSKWKLDPLTFRRGTTIHGNTFEGNGYDILVVSSSLSDGREIYNRGASIKFNVSRGCVNNSISVDRLVDCDISNNDIDGCIYGIFGRDLSGRIADNVIRSPSKNAICTSLYGDMEFYNNEMINAGLSGTGDDSRAVVLVYAPTASGIPSQLSNPTVYFRENGIKFPTGDALGNYLVFDADVRNRWHIEGTYGTATTKKFRIDGGNTAVKYQFRNHFAQNGYLNTAQNEPAYTPTVSSTARTFDSTTVTLPVLANVVGTMLNDQKTKFTVK